MMKRSRGFTLIEIVLALAIMLILAGIILISFATLNRTQALDRDTETIVQVLRQAQSQTLTSKNAMQYGVHFASSTATLFSGSTYSANDAGNLVYTLKTSDLILNVSITGSSTDVVFNRLTGETAQNGTILLQTQQANFTRTVTIYKTGVVQSTGQ
jgi:prepilin-type N-terminal cleavage/methylation domain-containing protein